MLEAAGCSGCDTASEQASDGVNWPWAINRHIMGFRGRRLAKTQLRRACVDVIMKRIGRRRVELPHPTTACRSISLQIENMLITEMKTSRLFSSIIFFYAYICACYRPIIQYRALQPWPKVSKQVKLVSAGTVSVSFLARDVIYTSRAYATMSVSVLSLIHI